MGAGAGLADVPSLKVMPSRSKLIWKKRLYQVLELLCLPGEESGASCCSPLFLRSPPTFNKDHFRTMSGGHPTMTIYTPQNTPAAEQSRETAKLAACSNILAIETTQLL